MHHHQGKNSCPPSRPSIPPEKHFFVPGMNVSGETGLVISTDAKPRLKWTPELHQHFVEAVDQLGGVDRATPKAIMRLMAIPGLTLYHLKSHLQKFRLSKNLHRQANNSNTKNGFTAAADRISERPGAHANNTDHRSPVIKNLPISEALQMQVEVQRRLNEQLEVQRHLQLRIEAQGKYLQSVLEKAQEALRKQNLGSECIETTKTQLSELFSKVSTECLDCTGSELKGMPCFRAKQTQSKQIADCSIDSCLTSCEGSQKDQEINDVNISNLDPKGEASRPEFPNLGWLRDLNENETLSLEKMMLATQRNACNLSIRIGVQEERSSSTISEAIWKERDGEAACQEQQKTKRPAIKSKTEKCRTVFGLQGLTAQLDLNTQGTNDAASSNKEFDLNGFSWN